ncbi:MAG TPA: hypothetical protein VFR35_09960 [Actinoplanes sp.]|nr:hypothetical protein [Actinoplanes sp.]
MTWDDPHVSGVVRGRGGPVVACAASGPLGRHGQPVLWHLIAVAGLGLTAALGTTLGVPVLPRICGVLLIAAVVRTVVTYRRTTALAGRIEVACATPAGANKPMRVLRTTEGRGALAVAVGLAEQIWRQRTALASLVDAGETRIAMRRAVWEISGALERRERLREIRTHQASRSIAGLPAGSPAVRAHRVQADRADRAWAEVDAEVRRHFAALRDAADSGEKLIREWDLGASARRAGSELDALGAPVGPGPAQLYAERTAAVVAAYRELAGTYGGGLYV